MSSWSLDDALRDVCDAAGVLVSDGTRASRDDIETFMSLLCSATAKVYGDTRRSGHGLMGFSDDVYHPLFNSSAPPRSEYVTTASDAALVPVRDAADEAFYAGLVGRLVMYAQPLALVLPEQINWVATSYSGMGYSSDPAQAMRIARLVHQYRDVVREGRLAVLPTSFDRIFESVSDSDHWFARAPLLQRADAAQPLPLVSADWSADQSLFVYEQVVLPFFPGASVATLAAIAREETEAFTLFAGFLRRRMRELAESPEAGLAELRAELDEEVARLRIEARKLAQLRVLRGAEIGLFTVSLAAAIATDLGALQTTAGVLGSVTLLELLKQHATVRREALDLRASEFYVPMILADKATKRS
jgi:hypothetical protein